MDVTERVFHNKRLADQEHNLALLEKKAKTEAWKMAKDVNAKLDSVIQELKKEKKAHAETAGNLSEALEGLNTEQGVSASLRTEVERLKRALSEKDMELGKVTETLEGLSKPLTLLIMIA